MNWTRIALSSFAALVAYFVYAALPRSEILIAVLLPFSQQPRPLHRIAPESPMSAGCVSVAPMPSTNPARFTDHGAL